MPDDPKPSGSFGVRWTLWTSNVDKGSVASLVEDMLKACPAMDELGYSKWVTLLRA